MAVKITSHEERMADIYILPFTVHVDSNGKICEERDPDCRMLVGVKGAHISMQQAKDIGLVGAGGIISEAHARDISQAAFKQQNKDAIAAAKREEELEQQFTPASKVR